jgi:hypothetical protein
MEWLRDRGIEVARGHWRATTALSTPHRSVSSPERRHEVRPKHRAATGPHRLRTADNPIGWPFSLAVTPQSVVIVGQLPPLYVDQVCIELLGSWNIIVSPRRQRAVWRRPGRPWAARMTLTLHMLSAALWQVLDVFQRDLEIGANGGSEEFFEQILDIGSR